MLRDITFGQFYDVKSPIHRLDPRTKIILLILVIVLIFLSANFVSLALVSLLTVVSLILSGVPFKLYLKNIKAILPIIIFTAVINVFYSANGKELFSIWKLTVTDYGIYRSLYLAFRIFLLIISSSVLTYTTTPNDLTDGIEKLLSFLKVFGLKNAVHTLAMMMTIALRFIPTLVEETDKIMNAQKARGADLENGKLGQRIRALIPILVPLLISAVRRAYELAEAMECRCYNGGEGRKRMKNLKFSISDYFAFIICLAVLCGVIVFNIYLGKEMRLY